MGDITHCLHDVTRFSPIPFKKRTGTGTWNLLTRPLRTRGGAAHWEADWAELSWVGCFSSVLSCHRLDPRFSLVITPRSNPPSATIYNIYIPITLFLSCFGRRLQCWEGICASCYTPHVLQDPPYVLGSLPCTRGMYNTHCQLLAQLPSPLVYVWGK